MDTASFLVLDDESIVRDSIELLTKRRSLPVRVVNVGSAREAIFVLAQRTPMAGMLLDVLVGDGNGFDVLSWARKQPVHEATPALMMTGAPDVSMFNRGYDLRAEVITKPFDKDLDRLVQFFSRATQAWKPSDPLPSNTDASQAMRASAPTPPTLDSCVGRLRELGRCYPDCRTRYLIGAVICAMKSQPERYGPNAVSTVARAIGEDVPSLYRYASVAERWTLGEFEQLLVRRGRDDFALKWSHYVFLATIASAPAREDMTAKTLEQQLSIRELRTLVARGSKH